MTFPFPFIPAFNSRYSIVNSLRLRASASAKADRTPGANGNKEKWIVATWVKQGAITGDRHLWAVDTTNLDYLMFGATTGAQLEVQIGGVTRLRTDSTTGMQFRDPSAWMQIVVSYDSANATASLRLRVFVNGTEITSGFGIDNRAGITSGQSKMHQTVLHRLGYRPDNTGIYNDHLRADDIFVDGHCINSGDYSITDFGSTNADGVWVPKAFTQAVGTQGSHLNYADTTSQTTMGYDTSGNANHWTLSWNPVASGVTYDAFVDTPTNNYCVLSPLIQVGIDNTNFLISGGNNLVVANNSGYRNVSATFYPEGLKGYFEIKVSGTPNGLVGLMDLTRAQPSNADYTISYGSQGQVSFELNTGNTKNGASTVTSGYLSAPADTDVIGCAFDFTGGARNIWWAKNGIWGTNGGVGNPATGANPALTISTITTQGRFWFAINTAGGTQTLGCNFGQRPFAYTPPSGFKALCTANLGIAAPTASGTFTGNAAADGPFVWIGGVPSTLTINGNAVTFGTHADKTAGGFKLRTSSASYNASGSNTWSATFASPSTQSAFAVPQTAQGNP